MYTAPSVTRESVQSARTLSDLPRDVTDLRTREILAQWAPAPLLNARTLAACADWSMGALLLATRTDLSDEQVILIVHTWITGGRLGGHGRDEVARAYVLMDHLRGGLPSAVAEMWLAEAARREGGVNLLYSLFDARHTPLPPTTWQTIDRMGAWSAVITRLGAHPEATAERLQALLMDPTLDNRGALATGLLGANKGIALDATWRVALMHALKAGYDFLHFLPGTRSAEEARVVVRRLEHERPESAVGALADPDLRRWVAATPEALAELCASRSPLVREAALLVSGQAAPVRPRRR